MPEPPRAFTLSLEFCRKNGYNQKTKGFRSMKRFLILLLLLTMSTVFVWAAKAPRPTKLTRARSHHHGQRHHAHKALRHHAHKATRHRV
jgi:predicted transposase YdaD